MTKGMRTSKGPEEEILQILTVMVIVLQCLLVYTDQKLIVCALYVIYVHKHNYMYRIIIIKFRHRYCRKLGKNLKV